MRAKTRSRMAATPSASAASTFRRRSGSVFDGRRLNHQSSAVTVSPSAQSTSPSPSKAVATRSVAAGMSSTTLFSSPDWT
jgi:hypothetical protein